MEKESDNPTSEKETAKGSESELAKAATGLEGTALRPQTSTRRHFITLGVSLVAGFVALFWSWLRPSLTLQRLAQSKALRFPHYHHRRIRRATTYLKVKLDEGFYARKEGPYPRAVPRGLFQQIGRKHKNVIQYVDSEHRIPFVGAINEKKLRPALPAELALTALPTHVSSARASVIFELAALQRLKNQQYDQACQLLINGIKNDVAFKQWVGGAPSLRLFDLLALVSVRRNQPQSFGYLLQQSEEAKKLITNQAVGAPASRKRYKDKERNERERLNIVQKELVRHKRKEEMEARLKKWHDETWQNKIKNLETKVEWAMTVPIDTTKKENKILKVAI